MSDYSVKRICKKYYVIFNEKEKAYFAGYDFMGSVIWEENKEKCNWMQRAEAYDILADLEASE